MCARSNGVDGSNVLSFKGKWRFHHSSGERRTSAAGLFCLPVQGDALLVGAALCTANRKHHHGPSPSTPPSRGDFSFQGAPLQPFACLHADLANRRETGCALRYESGPLKGP